ncbi:MAG TPA: redoxin domain-containing protein [Bacteroidales bacterium]|jgi:hypothetical protein|nr:MAG: thiol-disulfide oxidoreductase [Bacteroidetes bacterium ADurb.Bin012]HNU21904.1 redoxin domain-containing protein [Bacteroidales bacterium]HNV17491.1 redoxin domain-containing protein [Bacteroidales bacterium]HNZ79562.1 redoxin domain-containing protein [Bacteroidales bacterium]HOC15964.1 redoxin domain-containing protein [Bacteroidales bacterium]
MNFFKISIFENFIHLHRKARKPKRILLVLGLIFLSDILLYGGEVVITGNFSKAAGEQVQVFTYSDFLSLNETLLAQTTIDTQGYFTLEFQIEALQPILLDIAFYRQIIYVEPQKTYHIQSHRFHVLENGNPYIPRYFIDAEIFSESPSDSIFRGLEYHIYNFYDTTTTRLLNQPRTEFVELFVQKILKNIPESIPENYEKAILFRLASLFPKAQLPSGYSTLDEIPIDYNNYEYFRWMEDFFRKKLLIENSLTASSKVSRALIMAVNKSVTYHQLQDTISKFFGIEKLDAKELYTLVALKIFYSTPMFSNSSILYFLEQIRDDSHIESHKRMAQNLLERFTRLKPGSLLPDKVVKSYKGDSIRLREYSQKPLYIVFARKECLTCLANLEMLRPLSVKFKDQVNFLAIFTSHDTLADARTIEQMNYPWPSVLGGRNYELLRAFEAYALPLEMLISPGGIIAAYPAYRVNEGLEITLQKMLMRALPSGSLPH